jgi:hypothetical protein
MDEIEKLKADLAAKEDELRVAREAEAEAKATNTKTVEEIKELRVKKQEAEAERDLALAKLNGGGGNGDVESTVKNILAQEKTQELEKVREESLEEFKNSHKELFAEANDQGGIKFEAFRKHLAKLNMSGLTTAKQLKEAYEDALILMNKGKTHVRQDGGSPYIPKDGGGQPRSEEGSELDSKEQKLIASIGWTEEQYLKQKKTRPSYVASLLQKIN